MSVSAFFISLRCSSSALVSLFNFSLFQSCCYRSSSTQAVPEIDSVSWEVLIRSWILIIYLFWCIPEFSFVSFLHIFIQNANWRSCNWTSKLAYCTRNNYILWIYKPLGLQNREITFESSRLPRKFTTCVILTIRKLLINWSRLP